MAVKKNCFTKDSAVKFFVFSIVDSVSSHVYTFYGGNKILHNRSGFVVLFCEFFNFTFTEKN